MCSLPCLFLFFSIKNKASKHTLQSYSFSIYLLHLSRRIEKIVYPSFHSVHILSKRCTKGNCKEIYFSAKRHCIRILILMQCLFPIFKICSINEQITKFAQKAAIFVCCTKIFLALITQMFLA